MSEFDSSNLTPSKGDSQISAVALAFIELDGVEIATYIRLIRQVPQPSEDELTH